MNKHQLLGLLLEYRFEISNKITVSDRDLGTLRNSWFYVDYAIQYMLTFYPIGFDSLESLIEQAHITGEDLWEPRATAFADEYREGAQQLKRYLQSVLSSMVESNVANV